ncbi:hypothetical protein LCGC14_0645390 [marine sediment metagenome]|uniref:LamG-like jellyroll fold domain-containing protein n=1 Tax=marine sediment metagenome TaxID=412755 RepID=A0A0F9U699_9ZZZZ
MGLASNLRSIQYRRRIANLLSNSAILSYSDKVNNYSPIAYWPLWEAGGGIAEDISGNDFDGVYINVTLGQLGIGDGRTCPLFDGSNGNVDMDIPGLRAAFDGQEGTWIVWAKVYDSGVWTDGLDRYFLRFRDDASNLLQIRKKTTNNSTRSEYKAAGVTEINDKSSLTTTDWMCWGMTWSKTADEVKLYLDGSQVIPTRTILGTFVGPIVIATLGLAQWYGYLAHCVVWDTPLAPTTMAALAVV